MPTVIIVPGFNESGGDLSFFAPGRHGIPGFTQRGFDHLIFDEHHDSLDQRIDRYREWLLETAAAQPARFPAVSLGYSLGGIVVRGFLRKYPDDAKSLLSHTVQVGAPNWGIAVDLLPILTGAIRLPDHAMTDISIHSRFMRWLNGSGGHWEHRRDVKEKFWKLEKAPTVAYEGAKILSIYGQVPSFGDDNDGVVWADSATLGGTIPAYSLRGEVANHLNLVGIYNFAMRIFKGFRRDDTIWPQIIDVTAKFALDQDLGGKIAAAARAETPLEITT